jgi:flagellar motor switch/type III secretory pathway protein FliN
MKTDFISIQEAVGLANNSHISQVFVELDWSNFPLNPLGICRQFFDLPLNGRLIAIGDELNVSHWKGVSSQWSSWAESSNCQIRLDRKLVLTLLSETFGQKETDINFSCHSMSDVEKEIVETFVQDLIEKLNPQLQTLPENESNLSLKGRMAHFIWVIESNKSIGKIAISIPIERVPTNDAKLEAYPVRSEESCAEVTLKTKLLVGSSKLTLTDLLNLEINDFLLLEESDKNYFRIVGIEGLDYAIPVVIGAQKKKSKFHRINLSEADLENMETSNKSLSNDMLSSFPIDVKAEFRDVKITLKDLFALQSGWVLPIDQIVDNELFLTSQGKTIAKGELVVTGDKFGILVKEVFLKDKEELPSDE